MNRFGEQGTNMIDGKDHNRVDQIVKLRRPRGMED